MYRIENNVPKYSLFLHDIDNQILQKHNVHFQSTLTVVDLKFQSFIIFLEFGFNKSFSVGGRVPKIAC